MGESLEISLVAHDFPFDEFFELFGIGNHVFVVLELLVGPHNAQVDPGQVDLPRVLLFLLSVPDERKVRAQVVGSVLNRVLLSRLVVQKT